MSSTYLYAADAVSPVSLGQFADAGKALAGVEFKRELAEGESTLTARYGVVDGSIVDQYPGKTDKQVEALLEAGTAEEVAQDEALLAEAKRAKISIVRDHFNMAVELFKGDAAPYEVSTWDVQCSEYSAWLRDPDTAIPYVTALAEGRGMEIAPLMEKIGLRVAALARIQGAQQALEEAVLAAETISQIEAIELPALG